jgi:hypothetical protein
MFMCVSYLMSQSIPFEAGTTAILNLWEHGLSTTDVRLLNEEGVFVPFAIALIIVQLTGCLGKVRRSRSIVVDLKDRIELSPTSVANSLHEPLATRTTRKKARTSEKSCSSLMFPFSLLMYAAAKPMVLPAATCSVFTGKSGIVPLMPHMLFGPE